MVLFEAPPPVDGQTTAPPPCRTQVLIVGCGPSGLLAALFLARQSIQSTIVEKHTLRLGQPKAHAINPRSLEILRQAGCDTNKLRSMGASRQDGGHVRFVTTLMGDLLGSLPYERQDERVKSLTPEPLFNIAQPLLEQYLQTVALDTGLVTIHRGWKWDAVEVSSDQKAVSTVTSRTSTLSTPESRKIVSEFVIGADGTDSDVRASMKNVQWEGLTGQNASRMHFVSIHARGNLRPHLEACGDNRLGQLFFSLLPSLSSALIVYDIESSWVYTRPIDPAKESISSFTEERCRFLLNQFLGADVQYDLASVNIWGTEPRTASSFGSLEERVLLVGDAAHSFPPSGGLGINTGIGDVQNLSWKLALVIMGLASRPDQLLATYTSERRKVAQANATQSWVNGKTWFGSLSAVMTRLDGVRLDDNEAVTAAFREQATVALVRESIELNRPHFDSLGLQLGYVYGESSEATDAEEKKDCSIYRPRVTKGGRLPHVWLPDGSSTLDLVGLKGFTLLTPASPQVCPQFSSSGPPIVQQRIDDQTRAILGLDDDEFLLVRPDQHVVKKLKSRQHDIQMIESVC